MFSKLKNDIPSSIVVFLVALPLCLGIALASGAPLLSGLISGIIGGVVIGMISGSSTSVSGPAASLTAVVLSALNQLGAFETFLMAVCLAGVFQVILGIFKLGIIADYLPSNIIKGLLAAIGLILIFNQIPYALGINGMEDGLKSILKSAHSLSVPNFKDIFENYSIGPLLLSLVSLLIMIFWEKTPLKKFKFFPSALFVVIFGVVISQLFNLLPEILNFDMEHMVFIPKVTSVMNLLTFPELSAIGNYQVWVVAFSIAIIASLATLLNVEATDNIDPHKRRTPPNRELVAQGFGNMFSGLIGGIPLTSVIVRSSVNINAGSETKLSTVLHGIFLLLSVLFLSPFINLIPLSSLAAILLFTGYKLASADLFIEMYKKGWNQLIPFIATVTAIMLTDVLIGVLIGSAVSIFFLLKSNYHNPFFLENTKIYSGETIRLELSNEVSFLNKAAIRLTLWEIEPNSKVVIDATYSNFIDHDILELFEDYQNTFAKEHNIDLTIIGLKEKYDEKAHLEYVNSIDSTDKRTLNYKEILEILKEGNQRFVASRLGDRTSSHQINAIAKGQDPMALIVSSTNSGTSTTLLFDAKLGELMSMRTMGNIINEDLVSGIELACMQMNIRLVVVLGHSNCLATLGAIKMTKKGKNNSISSQIQEYLSLQNKSIEEINIHDKAQLNEVIHKNTQLSSDILVQKSNYLQNNLKENKIGIISAFHNNETGEVIFDDWLKNEYLSETKNKTQ
ncbi:MAG: SulP family inorganic anion transporter [Chitinophagales bacterium]